MSKYRWVAPLAAMALVLTLACAQPAKVTLIPKEVVFTDMGASKTLVADVFDAKDRPMEKAKVTFSSSAPEWAEVDETGRVVAKASGDVIVTATSGKVSGEAKIRVRIVSSLQLALPEGGVKGPAGTVVPLGVAGLNEKGTPADLTGIAFTSSAPTVATVGADGSLTLIASGETKIGAALGKAKAELLVPVAVLVPTAIKVPKPPIQTIQMGQTVALDVSVLSDIGCPMKYPLACTSSSEKVATVDGDGNVTGVGRGTAEIEVTAGTAKNTLKVVVR